MMRAILGSVLVALLASAIPTAAGAATRGHLVQRFDVGTPIVVTGIDGQATLDLDGFDDGGLPGAPTLPRRTVRLALPPDTVISTVRVTVRGVDERPLPGQFTLRPRPPMVDLSTGRADFGPHAARIVAGRDTAIYGAAARYPLAPGRRIGSSGELAGWPFITVELSPVAYEPMSGRISAASRLEVRVDFDRDPGSGKRLGVCGREPLARRLFVNYDEIRPLVGPACAPAEGARNLAIVTTRAIEEGSTRLADYVDWREAEGRAVHVLTESQWDEPTGTIHDSRADRIRAYLRAHYLDLGLGYVLLIGNPDPNPGMADSIPMNTCASGGDAGISVTDFYYADLSGSWDANEDGVFCDYNWDSWDSLESGEGVIDFVPEVYVGRFPVYSDGPRAADEILARVLAYEQESLTGDLTWRRRLMLPNSIYFFDRQYGDPTARRWDGATVGEWFIRDRARPRGLDWTTLYEREGIDTSNFPSHFGVDSQTVVEQWHQGYGFIFWTGHGSESGVYRLIWNSDDNGNEASDYNEISTPEFMSTSYVHMLADAPPPFLVHGSCSNGAPETPSNLGYQMLRRGAIATVSATRAAMTWHFPAADPERWEKPETWDGDVVDIVTEYASRILDGHEAGRALGESIALTGDGMLDASWYQKSIQNLYGDPLVRLVMCREDPDCDNGLYCDGTERCLAGSCQPAAAPVDCADPAATCGPLACDETADACLPVTPCEDAGVPEPARLEGRSSGGCHQAPKAGAPLVPRLLDLLLG